MFSNLTLIIEVFNSTRTAFSSVPISGIQTVIELAFT